MGDLETCAIALVFAEVHLGCTQVLRKAADRIGLHALRLTQPGQRPAQFQQKRLTLLKAHALGGLGDQAQYPSNAAIGLTHGGIGHVEIHGFANAPALYVERPILGRKRLASFAHAAQQGLEVAPQLTPVLLGRPPQCPWVLAADGRRIGIVVQGNQRLAPEQHELRLRR